MINNPNDIGFIHDIAGLDKLRQKALNGDQNAEQSALTAAARQFESIFTSMMLKSMRDANSDFKSDLMSSQNEDLYRQMLDEQMASEFSSSGSLGLADMIVAQLSTGQTASEQKGEDGFQEAMRRVEHARKTASERSNEDLVAAVYPLRKTQAVQSTQFDSRHSFVTKLKPYADKAARMLGVDSSLLIAQAALETGWGQKIVKNARGNSNNLFNIKADRSWQGDKVATQTLEYHNNVPVIEKAAFRSYASIDDSFNDYVRFLENNPRYTNALDHGGSSKRFIHGIHRAGYATDPQYADKVLRVKAQIDQMNLL
ncbi:flagellar assembly peptidoglycan hydrolase FlgJ [Vibrio cholerae]